jgi:hypothetical protein
VEQRLVNNLFVGSGVTDAGWIDAGRGNHAAPISALRDADGGQYALRADGSLRGRGVDPGAVNGLALRPQAEFTAPVGSRALAPPTRWSPGAYQE